MPGCVWVQLPLTEEDRTLLAHEFPTLTFNSGNELEPAELERTEVLLTSQPFENDLIQAMPSLRWVQVTRYLNGGELRNEVGVNTPYQERP